MQMRGSTDQAIKALSDRCVCGAELQQDGCSHARQEPAVAEQADGIVFAAHTGSVYDEHMNDRRYLLFAELVLIIAGVFVFRGGWLLLDSLDFMRTPSALWLSLLAGSAVTVCALRFILKHGGK